MGKLGKQILKNEAKKIYKENTKNIPKKKRLPFSEFFKQYRKMKSQEAEQKQVVQPEAGAEDFNFDDMVNINRDLQVEEANQPEIVEEKPAEDKKE